MKICHVVLNFFTISFSFDSNHCRHYPLIKSSGGFVRNNINWNNNKNTLSLSHLTYLTVFRNSDSLSYELETNSNTCRTKWSSGIVVLQYAQPRAKMPITKQKVRARKLAELPFSYLFWKRGLTKYRGGADVLRHMPRVRNESDYWKLQHPGGVSRRFKGHNFLGMV